MRFELGLGACVASVLAGHALAADLPTKAPAVSQMVSGWAVMYNTEIRYFSWHNTRGFPTSLAPLSGTGSGSQVYVPMALSVSGNPDPNWKVDLVLRGGYVSASQTTAGNRGSVSTPTDSQVSGTVTYNGFNGFQPFAALLVNLPTGKSALYGNSRFARMDTDLVDIGTYGEGWNFGPIAGVNIPITQSLMLTLSAGYTIRGKFNKEGTDPTTGLITATDSVRNGNEGTVTAALGYSQGALSVQGSASYSWDGESQVNELGMADFSRYRVGPRTMLAASAGYAWTDRWSSSVNAFWTHSQRNDVLDLAATGLTPEASDSNSDVFHVDTGLTYKLDNGIAAGPIESYLYRNHNAYDPTTFSYIPAKTRWSVGGVAAYNVTNTININCRVEKVWIHEDEVPGPGAPPALTPVMSGDAWQLAAGATVTF